MVFIKMMFKLTETKQRDCTHSCMCRSIPSEHLIDNAVMKHKHPSCWCYSLAVSHSTVCKLFPMLRILVYQLIPTCTQLNTSAIVSRKYAPLPPFATFSLSTKCRGGTFAGTLWYICSKGTCICVTERLLLGSCERKKNKSLVHIALTCMYKNQGLVPRLVQGF